MRKSTKLLKKFAALFLVVLLSIDSFAAVVGDNDGSAFIPKSEFENLKKNFAEQIENYEDSLNGKVDGVIANYIDGLNIVKKEKLNVINKNWEEVSNINGVLGNSFVVPDFDLLVGLFSYYSNNHYNQKFTVSWNSEHTAVSGDPVAANHLVKQVSQRIGINYKINWDVVGNCYRNLVDCTGSDPNNPGDIIWAGQAQRYHEKWSIVRLIESFHNQNNWSYLDQATKLIYQNILISNLTTLNVSGYQPDWNIDPAAFWPLKYWWQFQHVSDHTEIQEREISFTNDQLNDVFANSVSLDLDSNGKAKKYEHIISNLSTDEWRVSNAAWTKLFYSDDSSSVRAQNLLSSGVIFQHGATTGVRAWTEYDETGHLQQYGLGKDLNTSAQIDDNSIVPSIGMINNKIRAGAIYQDNEETDIEINKTQIHKDKPFLSDGFQLLAAKYDTEITWSPKFSYTHVHNGTNTYTDNTHEVDIYFSNGPFSNGVTTTNPIRISKNEDLSDLNDYVTTEDRKVKIKFKMPEDGIVYVKWVPHETNTTYLNMDWIVTLDLKNCSEYNSVLYE